MPGSTVLPLLIDPWFELLTVNVVVVVDPCWPAPAPALLLVVADWDSNGLTGENASWGDFPNVNIEVFPSEPEPEPPPWRAAKLAAAFGVRALISCPGEGYNLLNGALIVLQ
jgi:hypothetical protein